MKRLLCVSVLLVSAASQAAEPLIFNASAKIDVDATGAVTRVEPSDKLSPALQELVKEQVSGYRFETPLHNGVKAAGSTYVTLGGCAVPDGAGYKVSLAYKNAGPRFVGQEFLPPRYPERAYRNGAEADAVVAYVIQADGTVALDGIRYKGTPSEKRYFDKALEAWVAQFRYEPETVAGKPVKTKLEVPVSFSMADVSMRAYEKQVKAQRMASPECTAAASRDALEPVALDSPFKRLPSG